MPDLQSEPQTSAQAATTPFTTIPQDDSGADALSHLAKMSGTGSAFGQAEYVAINPVAITAVVFGMLSLLSLLFNFFLLAAVVGILAGLLALRQISHSNGTQSGRAFAIGGLFVSVLVGGGVGAQEVIEWRKTREQSRQCAELLSQLGAELKAEHYNKVYDTLMTDAFRERVDLNRFRNTFREVQSIPVYGSLEWIEWRGQPMEFAPVADSDAKTATTLATVKFQKFPELIHEYIVMTNKTGTWQVDNIPRFFPPKKVKKRQQQDPNSDGSQ